MILPANENAALPLDPGKEALDQPAPRVAAQPSPVLRGWLAPVGSVRRDHLDAVSAHLFVERIAVIGAISNQILWLGFDHVEVEAQLHQANFMVVGGVSASCEP